MGFAGAQARVGGIAVVAVLPLKIRIAIRLRPIAAAAHNNNVDFSNIHAALPKRSFVWRKFTPSLFNYAWPSGCALPRCGLNPKHDTAA